jgi:O-methyltransferase/8-demethyl-8-(2,3-dimethoxy-alpha-L-rhamnosyl)tetracenomycin-C 4'-O-methyltransferase
MIGLARLKNLRELIQRVVADGVPGDLVETGVWRGGACIYMRAVLSILGETQRVVWAADSFEGLPKPNESTFEADRGDTHYTHRELAVSLEEVRENFRRFGLLDGQVRFLKGWFKDTLPNAPITEISLLRLDGDMYESTWQALESLYNKVSPRGFVVIDDYVLPACARAVDEWRRRHQIDAPLIEIDGAAVYWQKS